MTVVGRVAGLWRYPVKSMAAEKLDGVEVSWHGLAGDRRWAFIRDGQVRSGFPWLTIRERPELARYRPRFAEPDRPNASLTLVRTPSGGELDVADPALAAELGPGVHVIKQDRGVFDTMPLSLLTTQTLAGLGRLVGTDLAAARFRPNLLVEASEGDFPEDAWVGRVLRIGGLRMRVDQRDKRCVMVTIDPVTLRRDPAILRAIARERDARLGVYGSTVEPGTVAVGDPVELDPEPARRLAVRNQARTEGESPRISNRGKTTCPWPPTTPAPTRQGPSQAMRWIYRLMRDLSFRPPVRAAIVSGGSQTRAEKAETSEGDLPVALLGVVDQTMQPTQVALWPRPSGNRPGMPARNDPGTVTGDPQRA
jgi:uncharacterized protein